MLQEQNSCRREQEGWRRGRWKGEEEKDLFLGRGRENRDLRRSRGTHGSVRNLPAWNKSEPNPWSGLGKVLHKLRWKLETRDLVSRRTEVPPVTPNPLWLLGSSMMCHENEWDGLTGGLRSRGWRKAVSLEDQLAQNNKSRSPKAADQSQYCMGLRDDFPTLPSLWTHLL